MPIITDNIIIEGIACSHCARDLEKAILASTGAEAVEINIESKIASVQYDPATTSLEDIKKVITEQGFEVQA